MSPIKKQNKALHYIKSYFQNYVGVTGGYKNRIDSLKSKVSDAQYQQIINRVNYYNKLDKPIPKEGTKQIKDLKKPYNPKVYFFDTFKYAKYFPQDLYINYEFGDVDFIPNQPSLTKSRPIDGDNQNGVLLKLDEGRHFITVKDFVSFTEKKDKLIGMCGVYQENRKRFFKKYFHHPMCYLGQTGKVEGTPVEWVRPKISISKHLEYKFILSLEGNDVASNLKWIMSSGSIAVSPKLTMETWYMEGMLIPHKHFIEIKEDFSDLEEVLSYYISHPKECKEIIRNANEYRAQFENPTIEKLTSLLVLGKYLELMNPEFEFDELNR